MATDLGQFLGGGGGGGAIEVSQLANGVGYNGDALGAGLRVSGGNTSYATVFSVSDSGYYISHVFQTPPGFNQSATSGCRVIIDGTTVLTTPNLTIANGGNILYHSIWPYGMSGFATGSASQATQPGGVPIKFNTSLVVQHYHTGGFGAVSWIGYALD